MNTFVDVVASSEGDAPASAAFADAAQTTWPSVVRGLGAAASATAYALALSAVTVAAATYAARARDADDRIAAAATFHGCLLYTSPSPRD